jgi:hypothetical protein
MRRNGSPKHLGHAGHGPAIRPGRRDFAQRVAAASPSRHVLPYTHVTDAYAFRDVIGSGELRPTPCRVFEEDLLYLFYGRPAYRAAQQEESNGIDAYWPVCFVLDGAKVSPTRCFPFDSGAFQRGMYADHVYHRMIKEDFEVDGDPISPPRVIGAFWRDERSYYDADTRRGLRTFDAEALDFEVKAYCDLIASTGRAPFDERASAIEAQLDAPLQLKGNTVAVILPSEFATPAIIRQVEALGALALPFSTVHRHDPQNMVAQIYDLVRDLLSGSHGRVKCW